MPYVCVLDPDGDIIRRLKRDGRAQAFDGWPCYHTQLDTFALSNRTVGIIGCAAGAPFAVRKRLPPAFEHHIVRSNHAVRADFLFRDY